MDKRVRGIDGAETVDAERIVVDIRSQRRGRGGPYTLRVALHGRVRDALALQENFARLGGAEAEGDATVGMDVGGDERLGAQGHGQEEKQRQGREFHAGKQGIHHAKAVARPGTMPK